MEAMTLTRPAAYRCSSAPALMPTGKPSEVPKPHSSAPAKAAGAAGANTNSSVPAMPSAASSRSTGTLPYRSSSAGPNQRPTVIADRNTAKARVPTTAGVS
ncbi:hypothetical protein VSR01_36485 [Actinacidiphila sp. DG2A-62]|nr:hypothetical protein [Actinacidiphila sp. DG2A-62]MEC3998692.1 hypothetical protein [Actinacidiphila sp. DG2A-62]